ncbi:MAG: hypothetical protein C0599_13720 [Salinivirgaceae bacterium]|nr:MAG: hypothetical protein C0599_13720 [Salinivirgaceae bacterium]
MKSIIYVLIAVFTISIIYTALPNSLVQKRQTITIQTTDKQANSDQLKASAKIIEKRLKDYGIITGKSIIDDNAGTIEFQVKGDNLTQEISYLLLAKGSIDLYETHNRNEAIDVLKSNADLMQLLEIPQGEKAPEEYSSIIGFCQPENKEATNKLIHNISQKTGMNVKFLWSGAPYFEGKYVLHIAQNTPAINKTYFEHTEVIKDKPSGAFQLNITFNNDGIDLWSDITKSNIGKNITITLDDRVLSSPKVMAQIKEGRAMISGKFSENDLKLISALANNIDLPISFKIKK